MVDNNDMKVGVIGLGSMGSALADALLNQGSNLLVWNRTSQKCARFVDAGATVAASAADAALESDVLIVCLTDHAASMEILNSSLVANHMAGKVLILLSTMSGDESLITAEWADEQNISYLDGSILGYPDNVRNQECMIVYSGPREAFESCSAVLNALGGMPRLVGEKAGISPLFDKAIYSVSYAHWIGLFHGAAMCEAVGAPLDVYIEATTKYWDWSTQDAIFLDMIKKRDYSLVDATIEIHSAAYSHVLPLSEKLGINTKLPKTISDCFQSALNQGYKDSELPALFEVLGKRDA
jgi:3-hydroxyisobutyrate dehydrogenase-like beta-hydroxyacid dehydrogenase